MVKIIGSEYTCQGNIQDTSPRKLEEILRSQANSKNERRQDFGNEDDEEKIPLMIAMSVLQPQPLLSSLDKNTVVPTYLFAQVGENSEKSYVSAFESFPPAQSAMVKQSNLSANDTMGLLPLAAESAGQASTVDAVMESESSTALLLDNSMSRDLAIVDELQKQRRVFPVAAEVANGGQTDSTAFLSAAKGSDSRSNTFIAPPRVIPAPAHDEGWHYRFRSWGGRHAVRISTSGGVDEHQEFPAATIELSPSSELVERRLHRARAIFESNGKWSLKVHADGGRPPDHLLQRRIAEEKDGV